MQSFPELTRSPYALQANSWFFSSAAVVLMKEIREPGAQSSGRGGEWDETMVVDEQVPSATCFGEGTIGSFSRDMSRRL